MAKLERTYNIPLRAGFLKVQRYRKAKKAIAVLKEFLVKHMKCTPENLRIGPYLNEKLWERGITNPPHHVKVTAIKSDDGIVKAELFGFKYEDSEVKVKEPSVKEEDIADIEKALDAATGKKSKKPAKKTDEVEAKETKAKESVEEKKTETKDEKPAKPAKKDSKEESKKEAKSEEKAEKTEE